MAWMVTFWFHLAHHAVTAVDDPVQAHARLVGKCQGLLRTAGHVFVELGDQKRVADAAQHDRADAHTLRSLEPDRRPLVDVELCPAHQGRPVTGFLEDHV